MSSATRVIHTYSFSSGSVERTWVIPRLWSLAEGMPTFDYEVGKFPHLDEVVWFDHHSPPTVREVLSHASRIRDLDVNRPIILDEDGKVMDGVHRICRAILDGVTTIPAVRFSPTPIPDWIRIIRPVRERY